MFQTLISKIKTTLELSKTANKVQNVYAYLETNPSGFPAVMFTPIEVANEYLTNESNMKEYRFRIYVMQETKTAGRSTTLETILPEAVDDIISRFDDDWGFNSIVNNHRIFQVIRNGSWYIDEIEAGEVAVAELTLVVNMATDN